MSSNTNREGDNGSIVTPTTPGVFYKTREYPHPDDRHSVSSYCVQDAESQNSNGRKMTPCRTLFAAFLLVGLCIIVAIIVSVTTILTQPQENNMQQTAMMQPHSVETNEMTEPVLQTKSEKLRPNLIEKLRKEICNVMRDLFVFDEGFSKTGLRNCSVSLAKRFGGSGNLYINMILKPDQAFFEKSDGDIEKEILKNVKGKVLGNKTKTTQFQLLPSANFATSLHRQYDQTSSESVATTTVSYYTSKDNSSTKVSYPSIFESHRPLNLSPSISLRHSFDPDRKISHDTKELQPISHSSRFPKIQASPTFLDQSLLHSSESEINEYFSVESISPVESTVYLQPSRTYLRREFDRVMKDQPDDKKIFDHKPIYQLLDTSTQSLKSEATAFLSTNVISSEFDFRESTSIISPASVDYNTNKVTSIPLIKLHHSEENETRFDSSEFVTKVTKQNYSDVYKNSFHLTSSLLELEHAMSESQMESKAAFSAMDKIISNSKLHLDSELQPSSVLDTTSRRSTGDNNLAPSIDLLRLSDRKSQMIKSVIENSEMNHKNYLDVNLQPSINSDVRKMTKSSMDFRGSEIFMFSDKPKINKTQKLDSKHITSTVLNNVADKREPFLLMTQLLTFPDSEFSNKPLQNDQMTTHTVKTHHIQLTSSPVSISEHSKMTSLKNKQRAFLLKTQPLQSTANISDAIVRSNEMKNIMPTPVLVSSQSESYNMNKKSFIQSSSLTRNPLVSYFSDSDIQPSTISSFDKIKLTPLVNSSPEPSTSLASTFDIRNVTASSRANNTNINVDETSNLKHIEASSRSSIELLTPVLENVFLHQSTIEPSFPVIEMPTTDTLLGNSFVTSAQDHSIHKLRNDIGKSPLQKSDLSSTVKAESSDYPFTISNTMGKLKPLSNKSHSPSELTSFATTGVDILPSGTKALAEDTYLGTQSDTKGVDIESTKTASIESLSMQTMLLTTTGIGNISLSLIDSSNTTAPELPTGKGKNSTKSAGNANITSYTDIENASLINDLTNDILTSMLGYNAHSPYVTTATTAKNANSHNYSITGSVLTSLNDSLIKNLKEIENEFVQTSTLPYNKSLTEIEGNNLSETTESSDIPKEASPFLVNSNKSLNISHEISNSNATEQEISGSTTVSTYGNETSSIFLDTNISMANKSPINVSDILMANISHNINAGTNTRQTKGYLTNVTRQEKIKNLQLTSDVSLNTSVATTLFSESNRSIVEVLPFSVPLTNLSSTTELMSFSQNELMKSVEHTTIKNNLTDENDPSDTTTLKTVEDSTQINVISSLNTNNLDASKLTKSNKNANESFVTTNSTKENSNINGFHIEFNGEKTLSAFDLSSSNHSTGNATTDNVNGKTETLSILSNKNNANGFDNSSLRTSSHTPESSSEKTFSAISSTIKSSTVIHETFTTVSTENFYTTIKPVTESKTNLQHEALSINTTTKALLSSHEMTITTEKVNTPDHSTIVNNTDDNMTSKSSASSSPTQTVEKITWTISPKGNNLESHQQGLLSTVQSIENLEHRQEEKNSTSEPNQSIPTSSSASVISNLSSTKMSTASLSPTSLSPTTNHFESETQPSHSEQSTNISVLRFENKTTATSSSPMSSLESSTSTILQKSQTPPTSSSPMSSLESSTSAILQKSQSPRTSSTPDTSTKTTDKAKPSPTPLLTLPTVIKSMPTTTLSQTTYSSEFATTISPVKKLSTQSYNTTMTPSSSLSISERLSTESVLKADDTTTSMQLNTINSSIPTTAPLTTIKISNISQTTPSDTENTKNSEFDVPTTETSKQESTTKLRNKEGKLNSEKPDDVTLATNDVTMATNDFAITTKDGLVSSTTDTSTDNGNVASFTLYPGGAFLNTAEPNTDAGIGFMPLNSRIPGMSPIMLSPTNPKSVNDKSISSAPNSFNRFLDITTPTQEVATRKELGQWLKNIPDQRNDFNN